MTQEEMFNDAIERWNARNGNGSFLIPHPLDSVRPIYLLLPRLFNRSPTCNVLILVKDFEDKDYIKEYLTNQKNNYDSIFLNLINKGQIHVLTDSWVADNINLYRPTLTIIYNPISFTFVHLGILDKSIYKLVIITKPLDGRTKDSFYSCCPIVKEFKQNDVDNIRTNPPVEEYRIPITIKDDTNDAKLLQYYNDNIRMSLNIFGGLDNIKIAMSGNNTNNASSMTYCDKLARDNGWNEYLDMSTEYNQQIDKLYNPIAIKERANSTYEMIRKRARLLANYSNKINAIIDIIDSYKDKKILIINKFADFADELTNNINIKYNKEICKSFHDKLKSIPAIDKDGNPIYYKTGAKKGKQKIMGVTNQKKLIQQLFNLGKINIISTTNSPDKELNIDVDVLIITSSLCDDIKSYIYRLSKCKFNIPIILYSLYCENTLEEKTINDKQLSSNHVIVNKKDIDVKIDNNSDCYIVY